MEALRWNSGSGGPSVFETPHARTWLGADGVLRQVAKGGSRMEEAEARQEVGICRQLAGGARVPVLVDMRGIREISRGARVALRRGSGDFSSRTALVVDGGLSGVVASFFSSLMGPVDYDLRVFDCPDTAYSWLLEGPLDEAPLDPAQQAQRPDA